MPRTEASRHRYWVRAAEPASIVSWPAWFYLLCLLLLALVAVFMTAPAIDRQVEEAAQARLSASADRLGLAELAVDANGQGVHIRVTASGADKALIEDVAMSSRCDTWLAEGLLCPSRAHVQLTEAQQARSEKPKPPVQQARSHRFSVLKSTTGLLIEGELPDETVRTVVLHSIGAGGVNVNDELALTGSASAHDDVWAARTAAELLQQADSGRVSWNNGELSANLLLAGENEAVVRELFARTDTPGSFGALQIQLIETVDRCDQQFSTLLSENTIRFNSGSASISSASDALLDQVAELAQQCDLQLDVEGHTDSSGDEAFNQQLSLNRANAVIAALAERGVDALRFTAYGYGAQRPVGDNATADGRRLNRRIEIKATRIQ